jgi:hypothetical protein
MTIRQVLFICSRNQLRSPTAEQVFSKWPGILLRRAGPFTHPAFAQHRRIKGVTLIRLTDGRPLPHPWVTCSATLFLVPPHLEAWKPKVFHLPNDLKDPDAGV